MRVAPCCLSRARDSGSSVRALRRRVGRRACGWLASRAAGGSAEAHARMRLQLGADESVAVSSPEEVLRRLAETVDGETFYGSTGNDYRGEFRAMTRAWGAGSEGAGSAAPSEEAAREAARPKGAKGRKEAAADKAAPLALP